MGWRTILSAAKEAVRNAANLLARASTRGKKTTYVMARARTGLRFHFCCFHVDLSCGAEIWGRSERFL